MQIDWWTLALQTVNFLIVVWLLSRFLYQPIKRVIEERETADRKAAEAAEEKVRAAEEAQSEYEAKLSELAQTQREEESKLHAEMDAERQKMLEAAEEKASQLIADAQDRIERERKEALDDLGAQIGLLAADLAKRAIGGTALSGERLLEDVTAHLDDRPETDLADLREDLAAQGSRLSIATAAPLAEADRAQWREAMQARFDGAEIGFETDPGLLGGAELRFPHAVMSFSVSDRLERAAEELKES